VAKKKVTLTFPRELLLEPIIYTIGHQFNLVTNIHLADVTRNRGWLVLVLEGDEKQIEEGLAWMISRGIMVEPS